MNLASVRSLPDGSEPAGYQETAEHHHEHDSTCDGGCDPKLLQSWMFGVPRKPAHGRVLLLIDDRDRMRRAHRRVVRPRPVDHQPGRAKRRAGFNVPEVDSSTATRADLSIRSDDVRWREPSDKAVTGPVPVGARCKAHVGADSDRHAAHTLEVDVASLYTGNECEWTESAADVRVEAIVEPHLSRVGVLPNPTALASASLLPRLDAATVEIKVIDGVAAYVVVIVRRPAFDRIDLEEASEAGDVGAGSHLNRASANVGWRPVGACTCVERGAT